ncbi:MAG: PH domain-containing protein [Parcubacteria group bacterium]
MKKFFPEQKSYENVILLLHRHWIIAALILIRFFLLAILPFIAYGALSMFSDDLSRFNDLFLFIGTAYFLIWWYGIFYQLTDYHLDIWIITDHRIVDTEQIGLFKRNIAETALSNMQDVTIEIAGFLETMFSYGNVYIQTAGPLREIIFKEVPNPVFVKDTLLDLYDRYHREHAHGVEIHEEL